ncbi:hypothetical protein Gotur_033872 [Gossypium turneri]
MNEAIPNDENTIGEGFQNI